MKRDMDLIRRLLLTIEKEDSADSIYKEYEGKGVDAKNVLDAHMQLMLDDGLLGDELEWPAGGYPAFVRLTPEGHDCIKAMREEKQ